MNEKDTLTAIKELGTNELAKSKPSPVHVVNIIGQIEGHIELPPQNKTTKYEHIVPQLIAIEQSPDIKGFLVVMNTAGGDVEAGLAIAEMIASMSKPSVSLVLGGGHSIGVPMAVSTDYSFITPSSGMTVHPIRMNGMIVTVPQTFEYMNKMQERILDFVCKHSHISKKRLREIMMRSGDIANEAGTFLIGKEAVHMGIIDEVGGIHEAYQKIDELIGIQSGVQPQAQKEEKQSADSHRS